MTTKPMLRLYGSRTTRDKPPFARWLSALCALLFSVALSTCGATDPTERVIRIFEPTGQVIVGLDAADLGGAPDRVTVQWEGVPDVVISGYVYAVWLRPHPEGDPVRVARFRLPRDSIFDLEVDGSNLINLMAAVEVILEPDDLGSAQPTPDQDFLSHLATARPQTLGEIGGLLAADLQGKGAAVRLAQQTLLLRVHTEYASQAADNGEVDEARRSIEHALNITTVPPQDHDNNGSIENPSGDDTGLDVHAERVGQLAREAVVAPDSWPAAVEHGGLAAIVADTVGDRLARLVAVYHEALAASDLLSLRAAAQQALALADTLLGAPTASVTQSCLLCGALTAWHQSLLMTVRTAEPLESFIISLAEPPSREDNLDRLRLAVLGRPRNKIDPP